MRVVYRVAAFLSDTAQSFITSFGGGNGDPAMLAELEEPEPESEGETPPLSSS